VPRRWSRLGIFMPAGLLPVGRSFETQIHGRLAADITVAMPLVACRGTLEPTPPSASPSP
jgi:hypothetical protein